MKLRYFFSLIIGLILLDAISKHFAFEYFQQAFVIINGLLSFQYVENTGIAFSIPVTGLFLKILTVVLIFGIFWYYWREERPKNSKLLDMSFALIFAGALGNAWERIFIGYVTDFIALERFAVFNLADSYISLGAAGVLWFYYKNR
ncbi:signal peptidase II [Candidatus Gracilibacteria bacterium]|nr:signal peptidase II [Candidatus Gracilibacteria bacterium]